MFLYFFCVTAYFVYVYWLYRIPCVQVYICTHVYTSVGLCVDDDFQKREVNFR